jgi:hypothetical protein
LGVEMGADLDRIITDFQGALADDGDDIAAIRQKIVTIKAKLRASVPPHHRTDQELDPIEHSPGRVQSEWPRHLSEKQAKIAQEIIPASVNRDLYYFKEAPALARFIP